MLAQAVELAPEVADNLHLHRGHLDLIEGVRLCDEVGHLARGCQQAAMPVRVLDHDVREAAERAR